VNEDENAAIGFAFIAIMHTQARLQFRKARRSAAIFAFHLRGICVGRITPDKDSGDGSEQQYNKPFD
jgi:hypothetical protein